MKKQKLISALNVAINALKNNTIHYDWTLQQSCNCGIVAQSILGKNKTEIETMFAEVITDLKKYDKGSTKINRTWQNGVKYLCPITGEPVQKIFKELFDAGMSKEDIVHLEYMDNPAILKNSGISLTKKEIVKEKKIVSTHEKIVIKKHPNALFALLGKTVEEKQPEHIYEEINSEKTVSDEDYHTNKKNLILYLQSWVKILQSGAKYSEADNIENLTTQELESELLIAVSEEKYEYATILRDKINLK